MHNKVGTVPVINNPVQVRHTRIIYVYDENRVNYSKGTFSTGRSCNEIVGQ